MTMPGEIRQIAVTDLGHEKPTLLLSNQMDEPASRLVDRYARRMVIENTIADAIDFFHMDALSAAVPMRIDLDVQLTLMASSLCRILGIRVGQGFEVAKARTIFRKLVNASAAIRITEDEIIVTLGRRANNPLLLAARYGEIAQRGEGVSIADGLRRSTWTKSGPDLPKGGRRPGSRARWESRAEPSTRPKARPESMARPLKVRWKSGKTPPHRRHEHRDLFTVRSSRCPNVQLRSV